MPNASQTSCWAVRILSDVTKHEHASEKVSAGIEKIGGSILCIKAGYTLTEEDLRVINAYLAKKSIGRYSLGQQQGQR